MALILDKPREVDMPLKKEFGPVGWGYRTHRLHLCSGVRLPQLVSRYDTKQSDGQAPLMLELWGMRSTSLLPSLPGPLWPEVLVYDRVQIELYCVLILNRIVWNRTVLTFKLRTYAKMNCLKSNSLWIYKWIWY